MDKAALAKYYADCGTPKVTTNAGAKAARDRRAEREEADQAERLAARERHRIIVQRVFALAHWKGKCAAFGVSPVCTERPMDPHELIPRSQGGKVSIRNSVPICRACHRATDATLGGRRLWFEWQGKADGLAPRADIAGNVWATWRPRQTKAG